MANKSAFLNWKKIQSEPSGDDIGEALRCEVRDALWLLARQWQLGEFKAEDAGMAAFANVTAHSSPLQRFASAGQLAQAISIDTPLNAAVERIAPAFDLNWRIETGRKWRSMLQKAGKAAAWESFRQNPLLQFKSTLPAFEPENEEILAAGHEPYAQMLAACAGGRAIDGRRLFENLGKQKASDFLASPDAVVDELGKKWVAWVRDQLLPSQTCWDAERLEYRFESAAAVPNNGSLCLDTPEYNGQSLGWPDFVKSAGNPDLKKDLNPTTVAEHRRTFIPARVSFPGMPRARWWEMEDSTIDLSNIKAAKTDTGALLLTEFCLLYSNDWLVVPLSVPTGHLTRVRNIKVTDVFGVQSVVNSVYSAPSSKKWELFQLDHNATSDSWLYVPPVADTRIQSPPIEEVYFLRDEMANMVWAVEKTTPNGLGDGIDGQTVAQQLEDLLLALAPVPQTPLEAAQQNDASLKYTLGTSVRPNWIPFIPFRPDPLKPDMVLRRAAMPRLIEGQTPTRIRPRTQILRNSSQTTARYDIQEEEIPVMGVTIRQVWRRARWFDGRIVTWLAREKILGKHTENSGLQFDQIVQKD